MAKHRRRGANVEMNLTSLMDVTFQLIVFFVLVSNFASQQLPDLEVPEPAKSQAIERNRDTKSVIISIVPEEGETGRASAVQFGDTRVAYGPDMRNRVTELLAEEIAAHERRNEDVQVDLRAHRTLHYREIQPVMQAITGAEVSRINLVAKIEDQ